MSNESHDHPGYKTFIAVWGLLLVLTVVTVYAAEIDLGFLNVAMALFIASTKASLVTFYFMHLKYENLTFKLMVLVCFVILSIFIGLTFFDTAYRGVG